MILYLRRGGLKVFFSCYFVIFDFAFAFVVSIPLDTLGVVGLLVRYQVLLRRHEPVVLHATFPFRHIPLIVRTHLGE